MVGKKVLMIAWDANSDTINLLRGIRYTMQNNYPIEIDIMYNAPGLLPTIESGGKNECFFNIADMLNSTDFSEYLLFHSNSESNYIMDEIRERTNSCPTIYTPHSLTIEERTKKVVKNSSVSLARIMELKNEDCVTQQTGLFEDSDRIVNPSKYKNGLFRFFYPEYADKLIIIPIGSYFHQYAESPRVANDAEKIKRKHDYKSIILCLGNNGFPEAFRFPEREFRDSDFIGKNVNKITDSELAAHYKAADAVLVSGPDEVSYMTALKGIMMGKPTIVKNEGTPKELLVEPELALGFRTIKPSRDVFEHINSVLTNPDQAKERAKEAQKVARNKFSIEKMADDTFGLYCETAKDYVRS